MFEKNTHVKSHLIGFKPGKNLIPNRGKYFIVWKYLQKFTNYEALTKYVQVNYQRILQQNNKNITYCIK